jgi:hypothetical protein
MINDNENPEKSCTEGAKRSRISLGRKMRDKKRKEREKTENRKWLNIQLMIWFISILTGIVFYFVTGDSAFILVFAIGPPALKMILSGHW